MKTRSWYAVDASGCDVATGRPPRPPGAASPAAALAAAPLARWPLTTVADDGSRHSLAEALGRGGQQIEALLGQLVSPPPPPPAGEVAALARATPAGWVELPVAMVDLAEGVEATAGLDPAWLAAVEDQRAQPRRPLVDAGRGSHLDAALNVAMLLGVDRLAPPEGLGDRMASGAQLWLLGAAVAWALTGTDAHPFGAWARMVVGGYWPIGPCEGRLVVVRNQT